MEEIMMSIKKIRVTDRRAKVLSFSDIDSESIPKGNESHILMVICEATKKERKYIVTINRKGSVKARCNSIFSRFMSAITLGWYQSSSATQLEESLQTHQKNESERSNTQQVEINNKNSAKATPKTKKQTREENAAAEAAKDKAVYAERKQLLQKRAKRAAESAANPSFLTGRTTREIKIDTWTKSVSDGEDKPSIEGIEATPGSDNYKPRERKDNKHE